MIDILSPLIKQFLPFAKEKMGFEDPPKLFLKGDSGNAKDPLGKTAYYDPQARSITVYITGRHPKDVMRSISHELVHHKQNCGGQFDEVGEMGEGYAQNDEHLREMEREAYEIGNMCFRDWEDSMKSTIYFEHLQKGETKMSIKDWKNGEIKTLLTEAWGFQMDLSKLNEGADDASEKDDDDTGTNPYGTKKDGSPEHHMGTGEGRGTHDNRRVGADGKPVGKNVDAFGRVVKDDDELEEGCGDVDDIDEQSKSDLKDRTGGREAGGRRLDEEGDELEEVGGVGSGASDPRDRRKPHGTGRPVDDKAKKKKDDELEEDSFPGKRDMEQHKSDLSERQKRIQALVQKALKEAIKKRKG
jgi:hypothetical protein|tara:strand:- start:1296 stop:2366 length:1071 start_codon:yes stop_codon:yes gene_type:complete